MSLAPLRPIQVLLVEDNPGDADLTRETLEMSKVHLDISVIEDGEAAVEFVKARSESADQPLPDLVILDLNIPKKSGFEVLSEMSSDEQLKLLPVAVLTSSEAESDMAESLKLGARWYFTKPLKISDLLLLVRSIESFWLTIVTDVGRSR